MKRFLALLFLLTGCAADTVRHDSPAATESAAPATEPSPVFTFGGTHRATADYGRVFTFRTTAIGDTLHEAVHILVPPNDPEEQWKSEAIAEYFPYTFYPPLHEQGLAYKTDMEVNLRNPLLGSASSTISIYERYARLGMSLPQSAGNDLSYRDAYLFAGYLADKYSFSIFLGFCLGTKSFKEVFGTTLEREKKAWHASILAK